MAATVGGFGTSPSHKQCTAMSKRSGVQCKGIAVTDSPGQKCRMHGGASASIGAANKAFKSGRHSKYLPSRLDQLYREAKSNPELLEMSDHIALLEARLQEVLATSAAGDPVPKWSELADAFATLETDLLSGDMSKSVPAMERMHKILEAGKNWDRTWNQVEGTLEQLRKLTDTEVKRKKELNQMVPVERVVILMAAVGTAVKRNVSNPDEIAAVYKELAMLHGSDRVPGSSELRVGPEVVDVTPVTRKQRDRKSINA